MINKKSKSRASHLWASLFLFSIFVDELLMAGQLLLAVCWFMYISGLSAIVFIGNNQYIKMQKDVFFLLLPILALICFHVPYFSLFSSQGLYYTPLLGGAFLLIPIIFGYIGSKERDYGQFKLTDLIPFSLVLALGPLAVYQFLVSSDLNGFVYHPTYSNDALLENENVSRRVFIFFGSPQSLGIIAAAIFALIAESSLKQKPLLLLSAFVAGLLSFSKVFILFLVVWFLARRTKITWRQLALLPVILLTIVILFILDFFERIGYLISNGFTGYSAFPIWRDALFSNDTVREVLFGQGLGVMLRLSQRLGDYTMHGGSSESFWLQIYIETGFVGLVLYGSVVFFAILKSFLNNNNFYAVLTAFAVCGVFTPALYSKTTGLLFGFVIGLCLRSKSHV